MKNIIFKIKESLECINGEIFYHKNEFIFETNNGNGEFSLLIGKGYCELSVAKFNLRVYSFGGVNFKDTWIDKNLEIPNSVKGELYVNNIVNNNDGIWYTENWNTYYDKKNNFICIGDYIVNENIIGVEFCKNIIAIVDQGQLKSIWLKNINFKE